MACNCDVHVPPVSLLSVLQFSTRALHHARLSSAVAIDIKKTNNPGSVNSQVSSAPTADACI